MIVSLFHNNGFNLQYYLGNNFTVWNGAVIIHRTSNLSTGPLVLKST